MSINLDIIFQDTLNPICSCGENIETTTHHFLYCSNYLNERMTLLSNFQNFDKNILDRNYSKLSEILLFGDYSFNNAKNTSALNSTIQYIFDTKRFDVPLTNLWKWRKFEISIYLAVWSMNRGDLILIRLILVHFILTFIFCNFSL